MTHDVAGPSVASAGCHCSADHGAAPAAKARTDADRDRTDKAATRPGEGTGDISEAEIDALEYVVVEGRMRKWSVEGCETVQ